MQFHRVDGPDGLDGRGFVGRHHLLVVLRDGDGHDHQDDGDYDQQLDERKAAAAGLAGSGPDVNTSHSRGNGSGNSTSNSWVTHIYILDADRRAGVESDFKCMWSTDADAGAAGFLFEGAVEGQQDGVFAQGEGEVKHVVSGPGLLGATEGKGVAVDFG